MSPVAKRYLIGGAVAGAALLTALGVIAFKAATQLNGTSEATPAPVAAALALPAEPTPEAPAPETDAPPTVPAADLTNAFGAALGV